MIWMALTLTSLLCIYWLLPSKPSKDLQANKEGHPERHMVNIPMILEAPYHQAFSVSSYDISTGGCFICFKDMQSSMNKTALLGSRTGIKIGDALRIRLHAGRFSTLNLEGRVVRMELDSQGSYPAGLGIQFRNLTRSRKKRLRLIVSSDLTSLAEESSDEAA